VVSTEAELTTDQKTGEGEEKDEDLVIVEPTMGLCEVCCQITSDTNSWGLVICASFWAALSGVAMVFGFVFSFQYGIEWLQEVYMGGKLVQQVGTMQDTKGMCLGVLAAQKLVVPILPILNTTLAPDLTIAPNNNANSLDIYAISGFDVVTDIMPANAYNILIFFLAFGVIAGITQMFQQYCFGRCGVAAARHLRIGLYEAYLDQEVGFHDKHLSNVLNAKIASEPPKVQSGLTTQAGFFWAQLATALVGCIYAFVKSPEFSLILLALLPSMLFAGGVQGMFIAQSMGSGSGDDKWASSVGKAGEALGGLRTVLSINARKENMRLYNKDVEKLRKQGACYGYKLGFGMGLFFFSMFFCMYGIALWYATFMVGECKLNTGEVFGGFFAFFLGGMGIAQCMTGLGNVISSFTAANICHAIINREPIRKKPDDEDDPNGLTSGIDKGRIELKNVKFAYPTRPDNYVFNDFSLTIEPGMTVAFVGHSGCGKSTIVNLLERFYDPEKGEILIDGIPIHNYNVNYLREQLSLVGQEPVLFDMTIRENISLGTTKENVTDTDIHNAAKRANAYNFIMEFPDEFNTSTGEKGAQMSGGQKQRVAIARAIMKQPKILLLDEATSALDTGSEKIVQAALDKLIETESCTCIVIAHRLSTIKDADLIVVMDHGSIIEKGNHDSLMEEHGVYYQMVNQQSLIEQTGDGFDISMLRQKSEHSLRPKHIPGSFLPR